jgi:hypothetical protein
METKKGGFKKTLDVDVTGKLLQKFVKFGVNLTFLAPWLPWQQLPF